MAKLLGPVLRPIVGPLVQRGLGYFSTAGGVAPPPANDNGAWLFNEPAQSSHMLTAGLL